MKHIFVCLLLVLPGLANAQIFDWNLVKDPTANEPKIYGAHAAGCMDGGIRLPDNGMGFVLGDVHENRAYGQPEMINYIEKLGNEVYENTDRTLIISDIASPRGGPVPITSSLHQSHQTGLDVDIWFVNATVQENAREIKQVSMLDKSFTTMNEKYWGDDKVKILQYAASFDEVDRIFVNPVIKKELCRTNYNQKWMSKIRPWWGHAAHFHVRLKCPGSNPDCKMQAPVPDNDGCGKDLAWWFSDEAKLGTGKKEPRKYPELPKECASIFEWKNSLGRY